MFESEIQFFRNSTGFSGPVQIVLAKLGNLYGTTDGVRIWLNSWNTKEGQIATLFHELAHCWQIECGELSLKNSTFRGQIVDLKNQGAPHESDARLSSEKVLKAWNVWKREGISVK